MPKFEGSRLNGVSVIAKTHTHKYTHTHTHTHTVWRTLKKWMYNGANPLVFLPEEKMGEKKGKVDLQNSLMNGARTLGLRGIVLSEVKKKMDGKK